MNNFKKDRKLTIVVMVVIVVTYILKNWGVSLVTLISPSFVQWTNTKAIVGIDLFLSAFVVFALVVVSIIGMALPYFEPVDAKVFDGRTMMVSLVLIVSALVIFVPLMFKAFDQKVYEYAFEVVAVLALCMLFWLNHIYSVDLKKQQHRGATFSALAWTAISTNTLVGLMWTLRGRKRK